MRRKSVLLGLRFSLDYVIQADTDILSVGNGWRHVNLSITGIEFVVNYVKTGDNSAVVYRIKSTGPSTEPRGTPYVSVNLSDRLSLIFTDWCLFCK